MRGKDGETIWHAAYFGITPAYAGKSRLMISSMLRTWDHPRVCGEKRIPAIPPMLPMGSPPRMRGKVHDLTEVSTSAGITPAYAGKRAIWYLSIWMNWDHPRVCGEKPSKLGMRVRFPGITPAYAGKSPFKWFFQVVLGDHPRVCGEKGVPHRGGTRCRGSPPRMRGKGFPMFLLRRPVGITPAYAGKRLTSAPCATGRWDHPRVCGEKPFVHGRSN